MQLLPKLVPALLFMSCLAAGDSELAEPAELQVLGVLAEPPEAVPGTPIQVTLLLADADGPRADEAVSWTLCRTPKALSEPGFASQACIDGRDPPLAQHTMTVSVSVPIDACSHFGGADDADLRPRDADLTGGYYQPLRALVEASAAAREPKAADENPVLARLRMLCPLRDAPIGIAQEYAARYRANQSPGVEEFLAGDGSSPGAGAEIDLRVRVHATSFEQYLRYDRASNRLETRTETLTASWFASAGEVLDTSSIVGVDGTAHSRFRAPETAGTVHLWVVLRDDRGGMNHRLQRLRIGN